MKRIFPRRTLIREAEKVDPRNEAALLGHYEGEKSGLEYVGRVGRDRDKELRRASRRSIMAAAALGAFVAADAVPAEAATTPLGAIPFGLGPGFTGGKYTYHNAYHINDFYPIIPGGGQVPLPTVPVPGPTPKTWRDRPLSTWFTLAQAQAAFPLLNFSAQGITTATQVDTCVWLSAAAFVKALPPMSPFNFNIPGATFVANGQYYVDIQIEWNVTDFRIEGAFKSGFQNSGISYATWVTWVGNVATLDNTKSIFLFNPTGTQNGTCYGQVRYIGFEVYLNQVRSNGLFTDIANATYINGITVGVQSSTVTHNYYMTFEGCTFSSGCWDGLMIRGIGFNYRIMQNLFYGVQRDGLSLPPQLGDFSTEYYTSNNEFGLYGRYAMLVAGGIGQGFRSQDDDCEGTYFNSYFRKNPEWFVQSVPASVCFLNCGTGVVDQLRVEAGASFTLGEWCDVHFVSCVFMEVRGLNNFIGLFSGRGSPFETPAATTFKNANGYVDITNTRNYNIGNSNSCQNMILGSNMAQIFCSPDESVLTTATLQNQVNFPVYLYKVPITTGSSGQNIIQNMATAQITPIDLSTITYNNCPFVFTSNGTFGFHHTTVGNSTVKTGYLKTIPGQLLMAAWAANSIYTTSIYSGGVSQFYKPFVTPVTENGFIYQITAVTSHSQTGLFNVGSPGSVNWAGHPFVGGERIFFNYADTNSIFPGGIGALQTYFVLAAGITANTFQFSLTNGGSPVNVLASPAQAGSLVVTRCAGAVEPTWPTTIGNSVTQDGITYTCVCIAFQASDVGAQGREERWSEGNRWFRQAAAPSGVGRYFVGDECKFTAPSAGGKIGSVCTTSAVNNNGGTWKSFGAIDP